MEALTGCSASSIFRRPMAAGAYRGQVLMGNTVIVA